MAAVANRTKGFSLATNLASATNPWTRIRGLMFRRELPEGEGLLIKPCSSIHMMFMRFPIDAVFFDTGGRVTKVARALPAWKGLAFGGKGAKAVIELPEGAAGTTEAGDELEFSG